MFSRNCIGFVIVGLSLICLAFGQDSSTTPSSLDATSAAAQPASGSPASVHPSSALPTSAHATSESPASGHTTPESPAASDNTTSESPASGHPTSAHPSSAHPTSAHPTSGAPLNASTGVPEEAGNATTPAGPQENPTGPTLVIGNVTLPSTSGAPPSEGHNATLPGPSSATPNETVNTTPGGHENANATSPPPPGGNETAAVVNNGNQVQSELPSAEKVKFFIVGFRHGNRNPAQFLKNDTSHEKWAWEGPSQLTSIGRRQAQALGSFLRTRYGRIVPSEFYPSKIKAYSSSAERCQQTLQSVMLGFYPPVWNRALLWQPVPYEISDPLLRMYNVKCPEYTSVYQPISEDSGKGADAWLKREDPELLKYISENSGLNASLSDLADVADNIGNMRLFNAPLPDWVTKPTLKGYSSKDVFSGIMSFAEAHQILCANDSGCARMMAGMWLDQIIQTLQQAKSGALKDRGAHFYAAHTETVLSLIRLIKAEHVSETPTSAGFILEYTDDPAPSVRFIFHEPDPNNADTRIAEFKPLEFCPGEDWCRLDTFVESVKGPAFNDWQGACKLPKCPTKI